MDINWFWLAVGLIPYSIKRHQTKDRCQRGFVEAMTLDQRVFGIDCAQPHVHRDYQADEEQHGFDQQ